MEPAAGRGGQGAGCRPRFAFLLLAEHPYGREMLRRLAAGGHVPASIVEEVSPEADLERAKFLERVRGHEVAPPIADQARALDVPLVRMPRHASAPLVELLAPLDLDLVVLGGTRVLRGPLLGLPCDGVVNAHPGLLPECRGSASPAWSVLHDLPLGATVHLCDAGIDTGDVLLRRELPVHRGAIYEDLCHGTLVLAGALMREALDAWRPGGWPHLRRPQGASPFPTFRSAPPEVLERVRRKLAEGTYARYVEGSSGGVG